MNVSISFRASIPRILRWKDFVLIGAAIVFTSTLRAADTNTASVLPTEKWRVKLDPFDTTPAIGADETLYLGTGWQRFCAISSNGVVLWSFKTGSEVRSSAAIADDCTIYFGCRDRKLYALTPEGKLKWTFKAGGWIDSSPAISVDGTIYFGCWDKHFYALNPDGTLKWKFKTAGEIDSSPAIDRAGNIYFGSHDKKFYALGPAGEKLWDYQTGGQIISSPALNADGTIYFTSVDGYFYALNSDGTLAWRFHTGGVTESSPVIGSTGTIYVGVNKTICGISLDGKLKWRVPIYSPMRGSGFATRDGDCLFSVQYNDLLLLTPDGRKRWAPYLDSPLLASAVLSPSGMVHAGGRHYVMVQLDALERPATGVWNSFRGSSWNRGQIEVDPL